MFPNEQVDAFFEYVDRIENGFADAVFSFVAVKSRASSLIVQSNLVLEMNPQRELLPHFESGSLVAAQVRLSDLKLRPRQFVDQLIDGVLVLAGAPIRLPAAQPVAHSIQYASFHPEGLKAQSRLDMLRFTGAMVMQFVKQPAFDWELRSADPPYDSVAELISVYGLGPYTGDHATLEVVAQNIVAVDGASPVSGKLATVIVRLAGRLSTAKVSLGYRILQAGKVVTRGTVSGKRMKWSEVDDRAFVRQGKIEIAIPNGAVVHCFANFDGLAQHHYWLADPNLSDNPRRIAYLAFDDKAETLLSFLAKGRGKGNARDLETGVAWLAWMLGFSVAHLGNTSKTQDAPDLILTTPSGHFAVVECTVGTLRTENKLPLVIARAAELRQQLAEGGQQHLKVIPVMVSSLSREALAGDLEHAARLGVVVLTRENLEQGFARDSLRVPDADVYYRQAEEELALGQTTVPGAPV